MQLSIRVCRLSHFPTVGLLGLALLCSCHKSDSPGTPPTQPLPAFTGSWTRPAPYMAERNNATMVYDSARQRTVLYGGDDQDDQTWEWDGSSWTRVAAAASPGARTGHSMVYDSARSRVVLFGGLNELLGDLGDTWTWDGADWREMTPPTVPPMRFDHAMAFDARRGVLVMFGGQDSGAPGTYREDTWEWDGSDWRQRFSVTAPPGRAKHAMTFHCGRGTIVLVGGEGPGGPLADAWEWDGFDWVQAPASLAPPAMTGEITYDETRNRLVMFDLASLWVYTPK